jgi:isopentenyl-diphosphate delta-isomerase
MVGFSDDDPKINTDEVADFKWMTIDALKKELNEKPEDYTVWFAIIFDRFCQHLEDQ